MCVCVCVYIYIYILCICMCMIYIYYVLCIIYITTDCMSLYSFHVTYVFQSESTLCHCLHVKKLLARNRCKISYFSQLAK